MQDLQINFKFVRKEGQFQLFDLLLPYYRLNMQKIIYCQDIFLPQQIYFHLFFHYLYILYNILIMHCCPQGSWPQLAVEYVNKGTIHDAEGVPIYHVGEGHQALVIISDIFGAFSGRHKVVADIFASLGYHVFVPEVLDPPYVGEINMEALVANIKNQSVQKMNTCFQKCLSLMESKGIKQYFAIGFCWGVWFAFKLAAKYNGFKAIAGPHPSLGIESKFYGGNQLDLTEKIKCPAFILPADNDPPNVKNKGELIELLIKRFGPEKAGTTQFPDMTHGWVVRGDLKDEKVARDFNKSIQIIHEYFKKFQ